MRNGKSVNVQLDNAIFRSFYVEVKRQTDSPFSSVTATEAGMFFDGSGYRFQVPEAHRIFPRIAIVLRPSFLSQAGFSEQAGSLEIPDRPPPVFPSRDSLFGML